MSRSKTSNSGYYDSVMSGDKYSGSDWLPDDDWYESEEWDAFDILFDKKDECNHQWEWYEGITDKYYYCTKCDEKTEEIE